MYNHRLSLLQKFAFVAKVFPQSQVCFYSIVDLGSDDGGLLEDGEAGGGAPPAQVLQGCVAVPGERKY